MIIVFDLEYIDDVVVGHRAVQLVKGFFPLLCQNLFQRLLSQMRHLVVAAFLEYFCRILGCRSFQHPLHPFVGEEPALHGLNPGGQEEIISIYNGICQDRILLI